MNIIFLDIDGVINTWDSQANTHNAYRAAAKAGETHDWKGLSHDCLDPVSVDNLNKITDATDAKLVISSTWRILHAFDDLTRFLREKGVKAEVISQTPQKDEFPLPPYAKSSDVCRGHEIAAWLSEHPEITRFVILDDDSDMVHLMDRLVQTSMIAGLEDMHVVAAIEMLS